MKGKPIQFCKLLREQIADEVKAPEGYTRLYQLGIGVINTEDAIAISRIGEDEIRHRKTLQPMEKRYCGGK